MPVTVHFLYILCFWDKMNLSKVLGGVRYDIW